MKILFVSANPASTTPLSIDEELRSVEREIALSQHRDKVHLRATPAARPLDLIRDLNREKPDILHISAHGEESGGIIFTGDDGNPRILAPKLLAELFGALESPPRMVLLNACFSFAQADEITKIVDVVISVPNVIRDEHAIAFSTIFYMSLCEGASVFSSFRQAIIGVKFNSSNYWQDGEPVILNKKAVSPRDVFFERPIDIAINEGLATRIRSDRVLFRDRDLGRGFLKREFDKFSVKLEDAAIIFLDVEGMGKINEKYGREIGNRVLTEIIVLIEDNSTDAVACGICGDDTFFCILEEGNRQNVMAVGRSLMTLIETNDWNRIVSGLFVRLAGGFAIWEKKRESVLEAVLRAGDALVTSQSAGSHFGEGTQNVSRRFRGNSLRRDRRIPEEILRQLFS
jgi:diguanylate cyclase (GGDEF)-like protein